MASDNSSSVLTGRRLGAYQVQARIGVGGMGEVYRAHDTRLGRDVAIKILRRQFTSDPDRLARFEREARVLASLNHPHIGAIYGSEDADGVRALVLELVQGETLADRIARGPIPLNDALTIARQIVDALDAAHEGGIVHRDLKPANIKITPEGVVKVLDFGLAKAVSGNAATADLTQSPTVTSDGTRAGVILGTAAYMSPEQARGRLVDKRTDVWAFGCVLFEMLAGRRAFRGETLSDTLAAILEREPDWSALRGNTPAPVKSLLRRLLEKDARRRLRDIADVRFDLEHALDAAGKAPSAPVALHRRWPVITTAAVSLLLVGALLGRGLLRPADAPMSSIGEVIVSQLTNYDGSETSGAISPDGRWLAFVSNQGGTADLWVRQVSGGDPVRLTNDAATESSLVFAPDGENIYFTRSDGADTSIWRIGVLGGQPRKVLSEARAPAVAPDGRRIAWFAPEPDGFFSLVVSALDGSARRVLAENVQVVVDVSSPRMVIGWRAASRTPLAVCSHHATCSSLTRLTEASDRSHASPGARKGPAPQPGFRTIVTSSFRISRQRVLRAGSILACWTRRRIDHEVHDQRGPGVQQPESLGRREPHGGHRQQPATRGMESALRS